MREGPGKLAARITQLGDVVGEKNWAQLRTQKTERECGRRTFLSKRKPTGRPGGRGALPGFNQGQLNRKSKKKKKKKKKEKDCRRELRGRRKGCTHGDSFRRKKEGTSPNTGAKHRSPVSWTENGTPGRQKGGLDHGLALAGKRTGQKDMEGDEGCVPGRLNAKKKAKRKNAM